MFQVLICSWHSVSQTEQRLEQKSETARETFSLLCYYALFTIHSVLPTECLKQAIQALIITITISSNVIGALAALFFTYHSVQLLMDSIIKQLAVITHL